MNQPLIWPSGFQMKYLAAFFGSIEWWRLEPAHELVVNQSADALRRMVAATTAERDLLVAYTPVRQEMELNLTGYAGPVKGEWLDPVKNQRHAIDGIKTGGKVKLTPRAEGDWVVLLRFAR